MCATAPTHQTPSRYNLLIANIQDVEHYVPGALLGSGGDYGQGEENIDPFGTKHYDYEHSEVGIMVVVLQGGGM